MIGIVLAGGKGTRLDPLTRAVNKHVLPVYDEPMICYPLQLLSHLEITNIVIVSTSDGIKMISRLLPDSTRTGAVTYAHQPEDRPGIAAALLAARPLCASQPVVVILGDNIFYECRQRYPNVKLRTWARSWERWNASKKAAVVVTKSKTPCAYGNMRYGRYGMPLEIVEKPTLPVSEDIVTGLYFYPSNVWDALHELRPSARGEYEITDLNNWYLSQGRMIVLTMDPGARWFDCGQSVADLHRIACEVREIKESTKEE